MKKFLIAVAVMTAVLPPSAGAASYKCTTLAYTKAGDRDAVVKGSDLEKIVVQQDGIQGSMRGQETIENEIFKLEISVASFDKMGVETIKAAFHRKLWNGKAVTTRLEGGFSMGVVTAEFPVETMIGDKEIHAISLMCRKLQVK